MKRVAVVSALIILCPPGGRATDRVPYQRDHTMKVRPAMVKVPLRTRPLLASTE